MKVALTFDDGPSIYTTRILNTLQLYGGHVTFFVMGSKIEEHSGKLFRASQMGCDVLCHAWDHPDFTEISKRAIKKQLNNTIAKIASVTGDMPPIFRPPYGYYDELVEMIARKMRLSMVNWSLDTRDWECLDADKMYSFIMNEIKEGDIVLCHDMYESTADAMNRVMPDLMDRGFELVTVSELLLNKYGTLKPGKLYLN